MKLKNEKLEIESIEAEGATIAPKRKGRKKKIEEVEKEQIPVEPISKEEPIVETKGEVETVENEEDGFVKDLVEHIEEWKKQYKKIYKNDFEENIILWRRLTRGEYKDILRETEEDVFAKQEAIVKTALLYPYTDKEQLELIDENAGFATVMAEEILAKSGFAISYAEEL